LPYTAGLPELAIAVAATDVKSNSVTAGGVTRREFSTALQKLSAIFTFVGIKVIIGSPALARARKMLTVRLKLAMHNLGAQVWLFSIRTDKPPPMPVHQRLQRHLF
jgi:hypothetical protein